MSRSLTKIDPSHCFCLPSYEFSAQRWEFLAEGGATVVFRHNELCLVLKAQKQPLSTPLLSQRSDIQHFRDNIFMQNMMVFVQGHEMFDTPSHSCFSEADYAFFHNLWSAERSLSRRGSSHDKQFTFSLSFCLVRYAYSFCGPLRSLSVGFEFKVKRGFPSQSPFIDDHYGYIKHSLGRFQLMQLHKLAKKHASGHAQTNWGEFQRQSQYNPTDLCSKTDSRIESAVEELFANSQNNLQVFANGRLVLGSSQCDRLACISEIGTILLQANQPVDEIDTMIRMIVSKVVQATDLFMRLQCLQYLDFIDSEGAAIIYERLCGLYFATRSEQSIADLSNVIFDYFQTADLTSWFGFATSLRNNGAVITDHLNLSPRICSILSLLIRDNDVDVEEKKRRYKSAMILVATQLTFEDCLMLLKAWMIGCVAADASIAVCIAPINSSGSPFCEVDDLSLDRQTVIVKVPDKSEACHTFLARLTVLDVGLKSFDKFENKAKSDAEICRVVSKYLEKKN